MVKERPGGPQRAYGRVQKRVEGPKSASLSVEHSRRYTPRQRGETSRVRKFVCKEIVVLVLRRERHLFYLSRSLAQLPALFVTPSPLFSLSLTLSFSLALTLHPSISRSPFLALSPPPRPLHLPPPSSTLPFPTGALTIALQIALLPRSYW